MIQAVFSDYAEKQLDATTKFRKYPMARIILQCREIDSLAMTF